MQGTGLPTPAPVPLLFWKGRDNGDVWGTGFFRPVKKVSLRFSPFPFQGREIRPATEIF